MIMMNITETNIKSECKIIQFKTSNQSTWKKEELDFLKNPKRLEKELVLIDGQPAIIVRKKE